MLSSSRQALHLQGWPRVLHSSVLYNPLFLLLHPRVGDKLLGIRVGDRLQG